jgi:hypothetical protein
MAKKDRVTYIHGGLVSTIETVNVHYRVGRGGENRPDDVMLIQALFRLIASDPVITSRQLGIPVAQIPEVTGSCDARTQNCIWAFQWKNCHQLLNVDGVIHPASYENRRLSGAKGVRLMAITLLTGFAYDAVLMRNLGDSSVATGLVEFEPRLKSALA